MNHHTLHRRNHALARLGLLAAIGAGLAFLFKTDKGKEIRENMNDQYHYMKERAKMSKEEIQERVKNIFGELSDELERLYFSVRADIRSSIMHMKDRSQLTREEYNEMIDEALDRYSGNHPRTMLARLKKYLIDDWENLKRKFQ